MTVDFSNVIQSVLGLCAVGISIFGGIALQRLAAHFNVQISAQQTATFDDALNKALAFGVVKSEAAIAAKGWDHPDVKNQVVGLALNYAVSRFPAALTAVGLSSSVSDPVNVKTITDALQRALPAAMTAAAASPATPPAPGLSATTTAATVGAAVTSAMPGAVKSALAQLS
jgi:hypothetical protein